MRVLMLDRDGVQQHRHINVDSFDSSRMQRVDDEDDGYYNGGDEDEEF